MANKTLSELRDVVEKVLHDWEVSPTQKTQYIALRDKEQDRYAVLFLQAPHKLNIAHAMFYLATKNDKIYVEFDSAKDGIESPARSFTTRSRDGGCRDGSLHKASFMRSSL